MQEKVFYWNSLNEFGNDFLEEIFSGNFEFADRFIQDHTISKQINDENQSENMLKLENDFSRSDLSPREKKMIRTRIAYLLSPRKDFIIDNIYYDNIDALIKEMRNKQQWDNQKFISFCAKLINKERELDPVFEGWLFALGYEEELEKWKKC